METYLVTGGCGFIGSNFIRLLHNENKNANIINLDILTYAGNPDNLKDIDSSDRYKFIQGDIADAGLIEKIYKENAIDYVVNFAAETHVDRAIMGSTDFINTDVLGVYILLEKARQLAKLKKFIQISTDEVYGSVEQGFSVETDNLVPRNPYSAAKAGGEKIAMSFYFTYEIPIIITRASNNFGPYQYPEKLIPLFISNAMEEKELPLYGDGLNVRDWLFVTDHCKAIKLLLEKGNVGEIYNIGGDNPKPNIEITKIILNKLNKPLSLIKPVKDRLGHDRRYALSSEKIKKIGWDTECDFKTAIGLTVDWYVENKEWWKKLKDKKFDDYYTKQYDPLKK